MSPDVNVHDLPMRGLKVVELGNFVSGPYCARLLADAGAEVIKVESPEGDESRRRGPFPDDIPDPNRSGLYIGLNANKLGITLDIQTYSGKKLLGALLEDADILIENNPPGKMEKLGLDFPSLHQRYPRLIVTSITPFGQTGPYRDYLGDDLIIFNMGGLSYATPGLPDKVEDPEKEPPLRPASYAADFAAAIVGSVATLMALMAREMDGIGRHADVSGQEAVASAMVRDLVTPSYLGLDKRRGDPLDALMPNSYFPCEDGYVVITAYTDDHWQKLVDVMGNPDWAREPKFRDGNARTDNWEELQPLIREWTMAHTGREIHDATQSKGLPCFPAYELGQAVASDQVAARNFLREVELSPGRTAKFPGLPFRFGDTPWPVRMPAPRLAEHNNVVLSQRLGYDGASMVQLRRTGVI